MLNNLMSAMPDYYQKSEYTKAILNAISAELNILAEKAKQSGMERFALTADETLARWEEELGIPINSLAIDIRRRQIVAKIRGAGTSTVDKIKSVAAAVFGNENVKIIEYNEQYYFKILIKIGGNNLSEGINSICNTINDIKPAHLDYIIGLYSDHKPNIKTAAINIAHINVKITPYQK